MMINSDYLTLFETCKVSTAPMAVNTLLYICKVAIAHQMLYRAVQRDSNIPWPVVAAIHFRESDQNFTRHLHNGDPLTARTIRVPTGKPVKGNPPFPWQDSATDALNGYWRPLAWDIANCLQFLERYNGLGYQKHGINSPYVWDLTDKYTSGLFVADGTFDPKKTESRPGCVAILKTLASLGVSLDFSGIPGTPTVLH